MAKKRKDGRYQLSFRYRGKKHFVYGRTKAEAETKKRELIRKLEDGIVRIEDPDLSTYYAIFSDFRRGKVSESTLRTQKIQFATCAMVTINRFPFGDMKLSEIKPSDCRKVQKELEGKLSTSSINDTMAHLAHVFRYAAIDGYITCNPCAGLDKVKRTEPLARETKHRALTQEETERLFRASSGNYYQNAIMLLIQTGIRCGELGALRYSDVDYKNNCIHINKTVTRNEDGSYIIGSSTKTKASKRDVPLTKTTAKIIKNQKEQNRIIFGNVVKMEDTLFRSPEGGILKDYSINRELTRLCENASIQRITAHALRATFATRFIEQRPYDYKILSELLGHSTTKLTLDLYTHVMDENKHTAMNGVVIEM